MKAIVNVTTKIILEFNDSDLIEIALANMHYEFISITNGCKIIDTEITDWEIKRKYEQGIKEK